MRGRELGRSGLGGAGGIPGQGRVLPSPARTRQPPRCCLLFLLLCSAQAAEAFGVFLNWFIWFCSVPPLLSASCIVGLAEPRFHWGFVLIPGYAVPGVMPVHPRSPRRAGGSPSGLSGRGKRPQFLGVITHEELIGLQPERGVSC